MNRRGFLAGSAAAFVASGLVRRVAAGIALLALAGAGAAAGPSGPVNPPTPPIRALAITANGAWSDGVSGDETPAQCAPFRLTMRDIRQYFARARRVDARAYHHDLEMSRCQVEGTAILAHGVRGRWWIDQERRGLLLLPDGTPFHFYCPACTSRRYERVYDPARDG